jgi:predicted metal-dependent peptidase
VQFVQCDAEVNDVTEYTRESLPLKVTYKGRGGTSFYPVIEYINEHHPNVAALVYLTDLEACQDDFGDKPHYPVLWVTTQAEEAPYGEVIKM